MGHKFRGTGFGLLIAVLLVAPVRAASPLNPADPIGFFTNLASRLLKMEMNLELNHLQIYPTNQYTPAVHRLLQVSANIYEATTNRFNDDYPHLPTLFRPRFANENGTVFITGYVEESNSAFLGNRLSDLFHPSASQIQPDDLVLGIPVVIGAKKGLPNFNEFSMETVLQITRKLELVKSAAGGGNMINQTNQLFVIGISNICGAEFWNSYRSNYNRPVEITVTNFWRLGLTNDYEFVHTSNWTAFGSYQTNLWLGWNPANKRDASLLVPMVTNHIVLPNLAYRFGSQTFDARLSNFERPSGYAFPRWGIAITNRVVAYAKDAASGRLIDYVQLNGMVAYQDLSLHLAQPHNALGFAGVWATNAPVTDSPLLSDLPGIIQQIQISKSEVEIGGNWQYYGIGQPSGATRDQAIANFLAFFAPNHTYIYQPGTGQSFNGTNFSLVANAPFTPTRKFSFPMKWQARDPMVHYLSSDLLYFEKSGVTVPWTPPSITNTSINNLGSLNDRYQPWGGNPFVVPSDDPKAFNVVIKDPAVAHSDDWDFPHNESLTLPMLRRIHRGTPWQTLYLKSLSVAEAVGNYKLQSSDWRIWTGNFDLFDALHTQPERDWSLVALIASLLNTNRPQDLLSINSTDPNAWLAALNGLAVLTNSASDEYLIDYSSPLFEELTMTSNSTPATVIELAIRTARSAQPNQLFHEVGDLLAVSALSTESPWLNRSSEIQLELGLTDEAYERIPAQLLARVRADSWGSMEISPDGGRVQFAGLDGFPYRIELSTNLIDWQPIATNLPVNGVIELVVPVEAGSHFYRSVTIP